VNENRRASLIFLGTEIVLPVLRTSIETRKADQGGVLEEG